MKEGNKRIWEKISEIDERLKSIEDLLNKKPDLIEIGDEYEKLIAETGISKTDLKNIIHFEEGDFSLLIEIPGKNNKEKMLNATLLILSIKQICLDSNRIRTQDLKNKLEYLGVESLGNLSTHIKNIRRYVIPDGKRRSPDYGYMLTLPGKREGIKILTKIAESEIV